MVYWVHAWNYIASLGQKVHVCLLEVQFESSWLAGGILNILSSLSNSNAWYICLFCVYVCVWGALSDVSTSRIPCCSLEKYNVLACLSLGQLRSPFWNEITYEYLISLTPPHVPSLFPWHTHDVYHRLYWLWWYPTIPHSPHTHCINYTDCYSPVSTWLHFAKTVKCC